MKIKQNVQGIHFLLLALLAFAGLGIEMIYAFLIEPFIYGAQMQDWTKWQNIFHWIITCLTWGVAAAILVIVSKRRYGFDIFEKSDKIKIFQWFANWD